jgi:hypothetical protein
MSSRPRKQNGRSRRGCTTCKVRKIRCDEKFIESNRSASVLLSCQNCHRTGRRCETPPFVSFVASHYESEVPYFSAGTISGGVSSSSLRATSSPGELRAFEHYIEHVAVSIAQGLDHDFWRRILPQVSEQDDSVRNAVLAISALYERPVEEGAAGHCSDQTLALNWYRRSVKRAITPTKIEDDDEARRLEHSILTCMLYCIVETQYCNASNALRLMLQGLNLISRYRKLSQSSSPRCPWMQDILGMFARQVMNIGILRSRISPEYNDLLLSLLPSPEFTPNTLAEARDTLYAIFHEAVPVAITISASEAAKGVCEPHIVQQLRNQQVAVLAKLEHWEQSMSVMSPSACNVGKSLYHALSCLQKMTYMWIYWILSPPHDLANQDPTNVDQLLQHADMALQSRLIKDTTDSPTPITMELGVISPVCFVLWSCRQDPVITEKATALLQRAAVSENMYMARLQADVVATLLGFEAGLSHGSGSETFVEEVLMHSYSWDQIVSDALNGVRRTRQWSWEVAQSPAAVATG